jgi:hypothetical protein
MIHLVAYQLFVKAVVSPYEITIFGESGISNFVVMKTLSTM